MGLLVKGKWKDEWYDTTQTGGKFVRSKSQFENQILNQSHADLSQNPIGTISMFRMLVHGHTALSSLEKSNN